MNYLDQILQQKYDIEVKTGKKPTKVLMSEIMMIGLLEEMNLNKKYKATHVAGLKIELINDVNKIEVL